MLRLNSAVRPDSQEQLEAVGLSFHAWDNYWNESQCYRFTEAQVDVLEEATQTLQAMCLRAVEHIIENNRMDELAIPKAWQPAVANSWKNRDFSLYGRFDLAYDGVNPPKMLEYNADTPTSLLESAVAQWYWLEDTRPDKDQFNSLHEKLVARWAEFGRKIPLGATIHFSSIKDNEEDWVCVMYLMDTAIQAGLNVEYIAIEDIGLRQSPLGFIDLDNKEIQYWFKLYPWEWLMREEYSPYLLQHSPIMIEPLWKSLLSNKGLLPILWELFPGHPNLLPAYFSPDKLVSYAKKPLFSREGANVELVKEGAVICADEGAYGAEGYVYQELCPLTAFEGKYPIIGSWVVGNDSAGICIREDSKMITTNMSNFIPHYFD